MEESKEQFEDLLNSVSENRKKARKVTYLLTFIPMLIAFALLFYAYKKFDEADKALIEANKEKEIAKNEVKNKELEKESLEYEIDSIQKINAVKLENFRKRVKDFEILYWTPESLGENVDSLTINEAFKANARIHNVLKQDTTYVDYHKIRIRFYRKKIDSDRVRIALNRTPFLDKDPVRRDWDGSATNRIVADRTVDIKFIKYVALVLLQEGVKIKEIRYFKTPNYKNLIEISTGDDLLNNKNFSFEDIVALKESDLEPKL